jgi:Flp pilus assembly protein TadD
MKSLLRLTTLLVALTGAKLLGAATYTGTVVSVEGDTAKVAMNGDVMPPVGARGEFFFRIEGSDVEVSVATCTALKIDHGDLLVKIESATGTVEKGQLVRFGPAENATTASPSPAGTPPLPSPSPSRTLPPSVPFPSVTPKSATPPSASQVNPAVAQYVSKGIAQYSAGDMDGAIASFTAGLQMAPGMAGLYLNRANAYLYKPNFNAAIADANKALELKVANADDAYSIRGTARARLGDYNGAIADCNKAIKLNPNHALAYNNRANNKIRLRDYSGAVSDCNRSIALNPNSGLPYYNRGFALTNLGDQAGALADWLKAVQLQASFGAELNPKIQQLQALGVRPKQTGPVRNAPKLKRR